MGLLNEQTKRVALIKFVSSHKSRWSAYLDTCVFTCNTSWQESTLLTPFELMYGQISYYDKKRANPLCYKAGAFVLVKDFTHKKCKGGKLDAKCVGPYVIQKKCTQRILELCLMILLRYVKRVKGAHLKLYKQPSKKQG